MGFDGLGHRMTTRFTSLIAAVVILAMGGCSGGSSSPTATLIPPGGSQITTLNAQQIAGASVIAAMQSGEAGRFGAPGGQPFGFNGGISTTQPKFLAAQPAFSMSTVPVGPVTIDCANGGSVMISGETASPTTLTAGDELTLEFAACMIDTETINGSITTVVNEFSGDVVSQQFLVSTSATYDNFEFSGVNSSIGINGDVTIDIDSLSFPVRSVTVTSESLMLSANGRSLNLTESSTNTVFDESMSPVGYMIDSSGHLTSSEFSGEVQFENVVPFVGSGDERPASGEFLVSATGDGSSVRLIVLDNINVRLEIDSDGDGAVDETRDTTWDEIL